MGQVPWAAFDPIFYLHHCNIDRIWASWNAGGRKNPTDTTFLNKTFVFADGNGNRVVGTIKNFLDIAPLGYKYDHLEPVPTCPPVSAAAAAPRKLVTGTGPIALGAGTTKAMMTAPPSPQATVPLGERIAKLAPGRTLLLVLSNLKTNVQPEVLYHLYLQLPANAGHAETDYYVGNLNFFEAEHQHEGSTADKFLSFDITELAKKLKAKGQISDKAELTIAPAGKPAAEAKPVIGDVSLVEQ